MNRTVYVNDKDACAWAALAELAKQRGVSLSSLLSEAIEHYAAAKGVKVECLTGTHYHRSTEPAEIEDELRDVIERAWRMVGGGK
jgi:hypothetical protein